MSAGAFTRYVQRSEQVHLLTGMPGNLGDHLIAAGTERALASRGVAVTPVAVDEVQGQRRSGCLVVPGSGAFSPLFHEWLPDLVVRAAHLFDQVVIAPSMFDPEVPEVHRALSCPNVVAIAREADSYRRIRRYGRAGLAIDLAMHHPTFDASLRPKQPAGGAMLVSMRTDSGSRLSERDLAVHPERNVDIAVAAADLDEYLDAVRAADHVVTDRLHVVVTAVMTGTRVSYVDPYEQKISYYLAFTFRDEARHLVDQVSLDWLVDHELVVCRGAA